MTKYIIILSIASLLGACKKQVVVYDSLPNDNFELPLLLSLDGKECSFDAELGLIKYSIYANSLIDYSPFIKFQDETQIIFESLKLKNNSINNLGSLELNKPYKITVKMNGEASYFQLVFTDLPIIQVVNQAEIVNGTKTLSKLIINYPNKEKPSDVNWTGIEFRGASSLQYEKKSFGIGVYASPSLDHPKSTSFFDFKKDQKWILNAMYIDKSRLRNKLSFDLWKSMPGFAEHAGIEVEYVEVFINRKAYGLYTFSMKLTGEFLDLGNQSVLYEGTDNSLVTTFEKMPESNPNSGNWEGWEQKFPDPSGEIEWSAFSELNQLVSESSNAIFKAEIGNHLDLDNVIDYYLFVNLIFAFDNVGKNWMFLKRDEVSKFNIIPWDLDGTWGRSPVSTPTDYGFIVTNNLFKRLTENNPNNYNLRLKQRWDELRASTFSESNISNLINSNFDKLQETKIIPFENQLWNTTINLQEERMYMSTWINNRLTFLDDYFY